MIDVMAELLQALAELMVSRPGGEGADDPQRSLAPIAEPVPDDG